MDIKEDGGLAVRDGYRTARESYAAKKAVGMNRLWQEDWHIWWKRNRYGN